MFTSKEARLHRFIPAGAGNGSSRRRACASSPVHPRGCGERPVDLALECTDLGSSPRVRGTAFVRRTKAVRWRFIPAGAGNGLATTGPCSRAPVHPRGCGERIPSRSRFRRAAGSSPRVRGTANGRCRWCRPERFIPAGAGNGRKPSCLTDSKTVHPRGCGERQGRGLAALAAAGSSPRVRGTGPCLADCRRRSRFIPAGAGNGPSHASLIVTSPVHPRGCGERPGTGDGMIPTFGSSPRVRGTG